MEIRRWHCYIAINCAVIIPCIVAKSVSLNELIAAESQKKQQLGTTPEPKLRETTESLPQKTTPTKTPWIKSRNLKAKYIPPHKKISLLKYRKAFEIKAPLKPSRLKYKLLNKFKNQSTKREISDNENIKRKYNPLLRNLGVLFDNLLNTGDSETTDVNDKRKYKRNKKYVERDGMVCTCSRKSSSGTSHAKSEKKTIIATTPFPFKVSNAPEIATETTVNITVADVSSIGPHKNVPLLLSRNTSSSWRNYNGHSKRSGPTLHGGIKRNVPGDNGISENLTRVRENDSRTESNEENTYCDSRDDASRNGFRRGNRNNTRDPSISRITTTEDLKQSNGEDIKTGYTAELQSKTKHDVRGNETKSRVSIPKHDSRSRRLISKNKVRSAKESLQPKENYEESYDGITHYHADDKRIPSGSSTLATEDKNVNKELEAIISIKDLTNIGLAIQSPNSTLIIENQNVTENLEAVISIKDSSNQTLAPQRPNSTLDLENQNVAEDLEAVISIKDLSNLTIGLKSPISTIATEDQNGTKEWEAVISITDLSNLTLAPQSPNSTLNVEDLNVAENLEAVIATKDLSNPTLALKNPSNTQVTENKNDAEELKTVISIKDLSNLTLALQGPPKGKVPVVTIFGGYSVARDINGQNKLSEQSIVIHS